MPALLLAACSQDGLNQIPPGDDFVAPGDALTGDFASGDTLEGDSFEGDTVLPPGDEGDLPEACKFYGIDSTSSLWVIDPLVPSAELVGDTGIQSLTDLAILDDGRMIAHTQESVYQLSPSTGEATPILEDHPSVVNFRPVASDALDNRDLIVGGDRALGYVDVDTGALTNLGDFLPVGWEFAGDIATIDAASVYATAKQDGQPDHLFFLNFRNPPVVVDKGSLGTDLVWGLDYGCDGSLYGLVTTDPLQVIRIDPDTVDVEPLGSVDGPTALWGAAGPRPQP